MAKHQSEVQVIQALPVELAHAVEGECVFNNHGTGENGTKTQPMIEVITGRSAFLQAWEYITTFSFTPLAGAVRT